MYNISSNNWMHPGNLSLTRDPDNLAHRCYKYLICSFVFSYYYETFTLLPSVQLTPLKNTNI